MNIGGHNLQSLVEVQNGLWFLEAESYSKDLCVAAPKAELEVHFRLRFNLRFKDVNLANSTGIMCC